MPDLGIGEAIAALTAIGSDAAAGIGGAAGLGEAAAGLGGAAAASAPLDILPAAAAFTPSVVGDILPATGALATGLATEPVFAGAVDATAAGLGGLGGAAGDLLPAASTPAGLGGSTASGAAPGTIGGAPTGTTGASALDNLAAGATPSGTTIATPPAGAAGAPIDLTSTGAQAAGGATGTTPAAAGSGGASVGGAAPAAAKGGLSLDSLVQGATSQITKNPIGLGMGALGLGMNLAQANKQPGGDSTAQLKNIAADLASQQSAMRDYLGSGTLPPGLQASVDQAKRSAIARAVSNAAAQGLPTDPTQNTALAQTIAGIEQQASVSQGQIANSLMQTGINEAGLTDQIYNQLVQIDQTQSQQVGKAISNFASALGGGGTKIQIGGTSA